MVETNVLSPLTECNTAGREQEKPRSSLSLVDYRASDFLKVEDAHDTKSSKTRLNTEKIRSYTETDFIAEMWKTPKGTTARIKSLKEIFRRKKYARFTNEEDSTSNVELPRFDSKQGSITGENEPALTPQKQFFRGGEETGYEDAAEIDPRSRVKLRTKILAKRNQRPSHVEEASNLSKCLSSSSMFNDFGQIEASISFAAHVRRQGPGFSASCTQTLRTSDFTSVGDLFESEVHSNVTFNPLFEDDDSDDDKRVRPRRHRLYTIDEESEAYDSGS